MKFYTHWARATQSARYQGKDVEFCAWGASNESMEAARRDAEQRAAAIPQRIEDRRAGAYTYADRPLREAVIERMQDSIGDEFAIISRNNYGCLVLNTASVMFVDIDIPPPQPSFGRLLGRFFGKSYPAPEEQCLERVKDYMHEHQDMSMRLYRTRAGFRCLFINANFEPDGAVAHAVMDALGADPLYKKLCRVQKSFRARLTPKPWRIGMPAPPARFPYDDELADAQRSWEERYHALMADWHTCDLIKEFGRPAAGDSATIVAVHDKFCLGKSKHGLA